MLKFEADTQQTASVLQTSNKLDQWSKKYASLTAAMHAKFVLLVLKTINFVVTCSVCFKKKLEENKTVLIKSWKTIN